MNNELNLLWDYTKKLASNWILWIFLFLDLIALLLVYFIPNLKIPTFVYWSVAIIGFFWAGFRVYKNIINENQNNPYFSLKAAFDKIKSQMPNLILEMKDDLSKDGNEYVREFFIISKRWVVDIRSQSFVYYFEEHENLEGKIQILENFGLVIDVSPGETKKYRMAEEFVELIKSS